MTVSYTHLSHTAGWLGGLTRLLFIWKGSLFKQIWPDLLLFFGLYTGLSLVYRFVLIDYEESKTSYELFCVYCSKFSDRIPVGFLLGFYVTQVVARWWSQFMSLPWPDTLARYLAVYLPGTDPKSRNYRRTVCRWVNLGNVLALRLVSYKVMVRFPTYEHLVESGLCTNKEMMQIKQMDDLVELRHQITWFPNMWAQNLLRKARKEGLIANDWFTHVLIKEVDTMANANGMLICYGWISIPLVYTQVVTLAVYSYFGAALFGRQYLLPTQYQEGDRRWVPVSQFPSVSNWTTDSIPGTGNIVGYDNEVADFYIPIFTILEYLFYMGWLKVAETLLNPFGEDDDDFDTYYLIERNLQISYIMADEAGLPIDPEQDPFGFSNAPELKHTNASATMMDDAKPFLPTDGVKMTQEQSTISSHRGSHKGSTLNIGTMDAKINLAGNFLAAPVTEAKKTYNVANHILSSHESPPPRPSWFSPGARVNIPDSISEEDIQVDGNTFGNSGVSELKAGSKSPNTSRNEHLLFSVQKETEEVGPGSQGSSKADHALNSMNGGMLVAGEPDHDGDDGDDGDGDGEDYGDGDIFDAEGW